jgi:16S rRNA (uracil1498-N3)-methyltransferase
MQLFYNKDIDEATEQFSFDKEESRHISRVLKMREGDVLHLTNGKGWRFGARILIYDAKRCTAEIISKTPEKGRNYKLHLAVAPTKLNDRYEWFLEKATEIGVDSITPVICDHSERRQIKPERLEKKMQAAMKQSLHCYLPELNPTVYFNEFMDRTIVGKKCIAHCQDSQKKSLKQVLVPGETITILIGPEGDFSVKEIEMAVQNNFIPVTLGQQRLRTETAAIVACHSVAFINE